jgi:hypothetical protein
MTTATKPRYRVGPSGVRRIDPVYGEIYAAPPLDDLDFPRVRMKSGNERLLDEAEKYHAVHMDQGKKITILTGILGVPWFEPKPKIIDPFSPERQAALAKAIEQAVRKRAMDWGYAQRYDGQPPAFSAWVKPRIVHVSWYPLCHSRLTACRLPIRANWHEAQGLLPFEDKRFCLRCQYQMAVSAARAAGIRPQDRPTTKDFRRTDAQLWGEL